MKLFATLRLLRRQREPAVSSLNLTLSPDWKSKPKEEEEEEEQFDSPAIISDDVRAMQLELSELDNRFAELHKGVRLGSVYEMEYEYIRQRQGKNWWFRKRNQTAFGLDWLMETKNHAIDSLGPLYEELHLRLDRVCYFYLNADGPNRKFLRDSIANRRNVREALVNHLTWCARRIKSPSDQVLLKTGLASGSLEDARLDFRDTLFGLAALYLASINSGIEPGPDFVAVASLSGSGPISTKKLLKGFEKSDFFQGTVAPKLKVSG